MPVSETDFQRQSYGFELPEELIAQQPAPVRTASRLMVLPLDGGAAKTDIFEHISRYLPENCLLVANNSRVVPARLFGRRASGGRVELLLLTPPPLLEIIEAESNSLTKCIPGSGWYQAEAEALLRSSKKVAEGECVSFGPEIMAVVVKRGEFGKCRIQMFWQGDIYTVLGQAGILPLPPYIRRQSPEKDSDQSGMDAERYQTCYARADKAGSVAAPTAGLHFTPELRDSLEQSGRLWAEVTLYVGYGTFSPVRVDDIREHPMHPEYVELSEQTAAMIRQAKKEKRPIVAVGTTSARVLEGIWRLQHKKEKAAAQALEAHAGWINIFLYPSQQFHVIDGLITNFHLPESSLLMLVAALTGRERILSAYAQAVQERFRFFSYGDAMLLC